MTGEALGFIGRYAPSIVYGFQLFFETRAEGKPLDAETVGELVRTVRPIYKDIVAEVDRSLDEFGETLRPEQHEVFERDRAAFDKRISYVAGKLDDWAAGRWKPEEWGIDKDPLWQARHQGEAEKPAASEPAEDSVRSRAAERPEAGPGYETAWELYVRRFIAQNHLDEAQQTTAWAILADLQDQAAKHWEKHADEHESLVRRPQAAQSAQELEQRRARLAELEAPIDALFGELKHRLDALPTAAQRRAADATPHSPDRP
jgi:hypothetical protein